MPSAAEYRAQIAKLRSERKDLRAELKAARASGAPKSERQAARTNARMKKAEIKNTRSMRKADRQTARNKRATRAAK